MAILLNYWGAGRSTCNKLQHAFEQQLALAVMKLLVLLLGICWLATDLPPSIQSLVIRPTSDCISQRWFGFFPAVAAIYLMGGGHRVYRKSED